MVKDFSIIVPSVNFEDLKNCLLSIVKMTDFRITNAEVIVVCNGCDPQAKEFIKNLGPHFSLVWFNQRIGVSSAVNAGVKKSTGKYIVKIDDDCVLIEGAEYSDWLLRLQKPFLQNNLIGQVGAVITEEIMYKKKYSSIPGFIYMTTRDMFNQVGGLDEAFNPGMCEDTDFSFKIQDAGYQVVSSSNSFYGQGLFTGDFPLCHASRANYQSSFGDLCKRNTKLLLSRYGSANCIFLTFYNVDKHHANCHNSVQEYLEMLTISVKSLAKVFNNDDIYVFSEIDISSLSEYAQIKKIQFPNGTAIPLAYRFKIAAELLNKYDNVLYLDIDTICTGNIQTIFNCIVDNQISLAQIDGKLNEYYWAGPLLTDEEKQKYDRIAFSTGVFAVNKSCINHLENIYQHVSNIEQTGFIGQSGEQHAFCHYVLLNDVYNLNITKYVNHLPFTQEIKIDQIQREKIYHTCGPIGPYAHKRNTLNLINQYIST